MLACYRVGCSLDPFQPVGDSLLDQIRAPYRDCSYRCGQIATIHVEDVKAGRPEQEVLAVGHPVVAVAMEN